MSSVNIRGLKRYAVDNAGVVPDSRLRAEPPASVSPSSAAGPSGLSAAYYLAADGPRRAPIFEQRNKLGGMLRYGIPSYRLPAGTLDRRRSTSILSTGVEVQIPSVNNWKGYHIRAICAEQYDCRVCLHRRAYATRKAGIAGRGQPERHVRRSNCCGAIGERRSCRILPANASLSSAAATWRWTCVRSSLSLGAERSQDASTAAAKRI